MESSKCETCGFDEDGIRRAGRHLIFGAYVFGWFCGGIACVVTVLVMGR